MMEKRVIQKRRVAVILVIAAILLLLAVVLTHVVGRELEKRTYKLRYPELIKTYAVEQKLDPYLVAAIIHVESSNRPDVVSKSGAQGLMQIMPETGEWIAGKLKMEDYEAAMLFEPDVNIRFGCWYLRFLLDRYDQDVPLAAAGYNAGQGTVDKWLENPEIAKDNALVNIPYPETDNYIIKVQRAYEKYKTLYKNDF